MRHAGQEQLCLIALLALALLHGFVQAQLRPLYQVSDEIQYAFAAQHVVVTSGSADATCASPPDGTLLPLTPGGGKVAFRAATAYVLALACRAPGTPFPMFALRAFHALSLLVLVGAVWVLARTLWPRHVEVAAGAGLLVAVHPILVKYGSAITPDAWANAFAAVAFASGARIVVGRARWFDVVALCAATVLALLWKETGAFLVLHAALVAIASWRGAIGVRGVLPAAVAAAVLVLVMAIGFAPRLTVFASTYAVGPGLTRALHQPANFLADVNADLLPRAPDMLASTWTALGNFGGTPLTPPPAATSLAVVTLLAGVFGWLLAPGVDTNASVPGQSILLGIWGACAVTCAVQPSVRQVLLQSQDVHQGRWLFPLAAPAAVLLAAGVVRLGPPARSLGLIAFGLLTAMWLTLGQIGRWYYVSFPGQVDYAHVFTRAPSGAYIGDERVWHALQDVARATSTTRFWSHVLLLAACTVATLALFSTLSPDSDHGRRPSHR